MDKKPLPPPDTIKPHTALGLADNNEMDEVQHHDRAWWRHEARRHDSDWPGILRLQAEVVSGWRAHHDSDTRAAA
jgi:hypothetical protein